MAYYLSRWYKKDELAFRLAVSFPVLSSLSAGVLTTILDAQLYVVCAPLSGAFGGLLASGILQIDSIGWLTRVRRIIRCP